MTYSSYRKILYTFPLSSLTQIVLSLKKETNKRHTSLDKLKQLEAKKISEFKYLNGWCLMERDILPSEDEYIERCEFPLQNYSFQHDDGLDVEIKFEFFQG